MSAGTLLSFKKEPSEKLILINKSIDDGCDVKDLQFLSLSWYGLVNDDVRRRAWPILAGLRTCDTVNTHELSELLDHKQAKQIELDVCRMGSMIPEGTSPEESERLITETKRLALSILAEFPNLHYYQGFHDVCFTFLSVLGPDVAFSVLKQLVPIHFTVFMQETMDATSATLRLVFDLLQLTAPKIWSRFQALNFEPFFTLSWFLTWFTHILSDSKDIHRLYDLFISSDPTMLIYLSVSVIICSTKEISSTSDDFGELHQALTKLPMKHDVEKLILCALQIYLEIPPDRLRQKTEDRRALAQTSSNAKFTLPINQRVVFYGSIAVLTAGLILHRFFSPVSS